MNPDRIAHADEVWCVRAKRAPRRRARVILSLALIASASASSWDADSEAANLQRDGVPLAPSEPAHEAAPTPAPVVAAPEAVSDNVFTVRVALREAVSTLEIALHGKFLVGGAPVASRTVLVRHGHLSATGLALEGDGSLRFLPVGDDSYFRIGRRTYRGALRLLAQGGGCTAVNEISLEDYLLGVVPGEIGRKLDPLLLEAVKAQAVVARTYAVRGIAQYGGKAWDLRDDVRDQVYEGRGGEDPLCTKAVLATRGRILVDAAGKPVDAYYHSTSGGSTADIAEVWPGKTVRSYLRGVEDTAPDGRAWGTWAPSARWTETWSARILHAAVRRDLSEATNKSCDPGEVVGLSISGYDKSGRARKLVVRGRRGTCEVVGDRIRWALKRPGGKGILRSTRFSLEATAGGYVARGTGNGHGVGLSQTGALGRARAGQSCDSILLSYYPGTVLTRTAPRNPTP